MSSNKKNDLTPNKRYIIYGVNDNEQLTSNAVSLFTEPGNRTPTGPIETVNTDITTVTDIIEKAKEQAIERQRERRRKSSQNVSVKPGGDNVKVEITVSSNHPSYSPITTSTLSSSSSSSSKNKRKSSPKGTKGSPKNPKKKGGKKTKKIIKKNKKSKKIKKTKKGGRRKCLKSL